MASKIISCPACNARFDVAKYPPGSRVRCGRCSQVLTVPTPTGTGSDAIPAPKPGASRAAPPEASTQTRSKAVSRGAVAAKVAEPPPVPASARPETPVAASLSMPSGEGRDPLLGRVVNAQFRVVRKLGEGGYGAVYEARDVNLERRIALKIMLPSRAASREYVAKFFREARTAAQLTHPNVVAVHMVGLDKENSVYFLAMEYVEGRTLHDVLQEQGPLPVNVAVDYMIQSCRGLAAAHERNIIHRDIKPGNLMITPGGTIKIADFGLAKIYEGEGGAQSTVIGTPYFMPPEQFEGKARDGRTDIYALGVTFYYMLTLQRAHTGAGPAQILLSVMTKEPISVLEHRPELPEGIWPIVRRMIHRDVDSRYPNCAEIVRDLEQLMGGGEEEIEHVYCPACGAANELASTQCESCKASLLEKCPVCGGEDAAGTKFCGNCGSNIPAERAVAALVDEARQFLAQGRIGRAREKLEQARERSPENVSVAEGLKEFDVKREQRDVHRDAIRDLLAKGRTTEANERLAIAMTQFPDSAEIAEVANEVAAAIAGPETTGSISAVHHAVAEARRLEEAGRIREALVAWRGVRLLNGSDADARAGELRTEDRVSRADRLLAEGTELLHGGDPEAALARLVDANAVLPGDPLVEGRIKEAARLGEDLRNELESIEKDIKNNRAVAAARRLRALAERYPKARDVQEALSRAESAGRDARRDAAREKLGAAIAAAKRHEESRRLRDAAQSWREAATLDPDSAEAQEGVGRVERQLAEFDALLAQSRNLLASGDPGGAEKVAAEALAIIAGDPAGEAQLARSRTQVETLRHEVERIRSSLAGEPDDDVLSWARELAATYPGSALAEEVLRETEAKCKEASEKAGEKKYAGHIERARKLEAEGNFAQALKGYEEILRALPDHGEARTARTRINERFGRARVKAAEATRLLVAGDPNGARAAAEASLELLADQREVAGTLAGARTALAEIDRAAKSFLDVLAVDRAEQQLDRLRRLEAKYPLSAECAELVRKGVAALSAANEHAVKAKVRAHCDAARDAIAEGRLDDAERECGEALAIDAGNAQAQELLASAKDRTARAAKSLEAGRAALAAARNTEARDHFSAALEANPRLAEATRGRATAVAAIAKAAADLAAAVERANAASRAAGPRNALKAWEEVQALDPAHAEAKDQIGALNAKIEQATADLARGRGLLAGDPEAAIPPLEAARSVLGPEVDPFLATAREGAAALAKSIREIDNALNAITGPLEDIARNAAKLAAKFPASARARDAAAHAAVGSPGTELEFAL